MIYHLVVIALVVQENVIKTQVIKYGGYSSTVRTSDCGSESEGSIPSSHPEIKTYLNLNK